MNNAEALGIAPGQLWFWRGCFADPAIVMIIGICVPIIHVRCWNALVYDDTWQYWALRTFAFDTPEHWTRIT